MRTKLTAPFRRAPRVDRSTHDHVHFHTDTDGRPYVCNVHRCESPQLSLAEVQI